VGDTVKAGGELAIIEAMKMENVIYADYDVTIKKIHAKDGESLISGQLVLEFA
jgi:propionyl-CoA carboxylase alpha chain